MAQRFPPARPQDEYLRDDVRGFDTLVSCNQPAWMVAQISSIYRYPVKGLTPEKRISVQAATGEAIQNDRRFALALGSTQVDSTVSEWMPKTNYLMLARNERLALLDCSFDDETEILTVHRAGHQVARGKLTEKIGRTLIEDFFSAFLGDECRGKPKIVEAAQGHALSDHKSPVISLINLATLQDLERVVGQTPDPRRFRGNLLLDGLDPWEEFEMIDHRFRIGDAVIQIKQRIDRCAATNVNPETATRDLNIPKSLQSAYGHIDCGIFATVISGGTIEEGAKLERE